MLPVLLDLKFIKIYTFGVFLVLSFFWGCFLLWKNIRLTSHKEDEIFDGVFISLAGSLFLGRLFYVILNFKDFGFDIVKFILINGYPGLSIYGTIIGGLLMMAFYLYSKKVDVQETLDYFVSPIFLALGFGKLGSFFSGAEVGIKTKFLLSIKYVGFDGLRHLTPFYEAVLFFIGAYFSYRILFEIRKERLSHGFLIRFFVWYFALVYLAFDKLKANAVYFYGFRFNWLISFILLLTLSVYFLYYFKSPIISRLGIISNLISHYGKKAVKKIRLGPKRKAHQGEGKNP